MREGREYRVVWSSCGGIITNIYSTNWSMLPRGLCQNACPERCVERIKAAHTSEKHLAEYGLHYSVLRTTTYILRCAPSI
jgi:hypothetical protein